MNRLDAERDVVRREMVLLPPCGSPMLSKVWIDVFDGRRDFVLGRLDAEEFDQIRRSLRRATSVSSANSIWKTGTSGCVCDESSRCSQRLRCRRSQASSSAANH